MLVLNIVVRIADDKDFLSPIIACIGRLKKEGIDVRFNVIGNVYDEKIYQKLVALTKAWQIAEIVHFTRRSTSYAMLDEEIKNGYFINYSQDDVVGYATMEAMNMGLKTILFNCHPQVQETRPGQITFCNNTDDLFHVLRSLATDELAIKNKIIQENNAFKASFFLDENEKKTLLSLF